MSLIVELYYVYYNFVLTVFMANNSEKKKDKLNAKFDTYFTGVFIAIIVIHIIHKLLFNWSNMTFFGFVGFLIPIMIMTMCYFYVKMKMESLVYTMAIESYAFDVFVIVSVVIVLSLITSYAWLLYLTIPGYLIYTYGKSLLNWVFTPDPEEPSKENLDPKEKRRQERKEKKEKGKVIKYH